MGRTQVTKAALKCERCGHVWIPRKPGGLVRICPKCKSAYWDTPYGKVFIRDQPLPDI